MSQKKISFSFTRSEGFLISALALFQFTHILDFMILMPLGPSLIKDFGITTHQFSWLVSSYTFSAAIVALIASTFIDRFRRKEALIVVYAGFLIGSLFCGLSNNFYLLLGSRVVTGAFGGLTNALIFAIVGDSFEYSKRGSATGVIMAAFSVATVLGVPIGLWLANHFEWNAPFVALYYVGIIISVYAYYAIPVTKKVARTHLYKDLFTEKNHYIAFALIFFLMLAGFSIIPYISNYLVFNVGLPKEDLLYVYLSGGAATFFTSRIFGFIADKYGKKRTYFAIAAISTIPIYLISHIRKPDLLVILSVTTAFFIFISGRLIPAMAMITSSVKPHMRGSFMTINSSVQQFGAALATLVGGMLISEDGVNRITGYESVSFFAIGITIITYYFVYRIKVIDGKEVIL